MSQLSVYDVYVQSEGDIFSITPEQDGRRITRAYMKDSIIDFFPYSEIFLQDPLGEVLSKIYFLEALPFTIKIGSPEEKNDLNEIVRGGYLEGNFQWLKQDLVNTEITSHISGESLNCFANEYRFKNFPKRHAFKKSISQTVVDVLDTQWNFPLDKRFITNTTNDPRDIWYQSGRTPSDFLKYLSNRAYTLENTEESTFRTFINLNNEFYFMSYSDLYNQTPVKELKISFTSDMLYNSGYIRQIELANAGFVTNQDMHNPSFFKVNPDGSITEEQSKATDKNVKTSIKDKYLLYTSATEEATQFYNLRVARSTDSETMKGKLNSYFENIQLVYQIQITVIFDKDLVSGKTVNLVADTSEDSKKLSVFNGSWLIIKSEHARFMDGTAYTKITVAKPSIQIDNDYVFSTYL